MRFFLLSTAFLFSAVNTAGAQIIDMGELGNAQSYEPGAISSASGALGNSLWSGTSADIAETLINKLPYDYKRITARDLARTALLSPGAPPSSDLDDSFAQTRMDAVIKISEVVAAQEIMQRTASLSSSLTLKTDMALLAGDVTSACEQSDSIQDARSESYWMKLRAFCHVERGETAAADVTLDLLRNSGKLDSGFAQLMRPLTGVPGSPDLSDVNADPLSIVMMNKAGLSWPDGAYPSVAAAQMAFSRVASADDRLKALFAAGSAVSDGQMTEIITSLNPAGNAVDAGLAGGLIGQSAEPDLSVALADKSAKGFSQLYTLIQSGNSNDKLPALIEVLQRADEAGALDRFVKLLEAPLLTLSYNQLRPQDIPLIAKAAILRRDISALQQIHGQLGENEAAKDRIALAADALGNGFFGGSLGTDIDSRLITPSKKPRALRDALLAHALGAILSDEALRSLDGKHINGNLSGDMIALEASIRKRAQAETALRAALLLESRPETRLSDGLLFTIVDGLYRAGLTDQAAQLAALDFLTDFPS